MSATIAPARAATTAVEVHGEIEPIADEWDTLASALSADHFARPGWIQRWHSTFGRGELEVLALREGGRLEAVLPLERRGTVLAAAADSHSYRFELLALARHQAIELTRAAVSRTTRRLELCELDADGTAAAALEELAARGEYAIRLLELRRPLKVRLVEGSDGVSVVRTSAARRELRRCRRRLRELGTVVLDRQDGRRRLEELLDEGLAIEGSGWKSAAGTAIESDPATARFYRDVARWAALSGTLRLDFLRVDGRAIAFYMSLANTAVGTIHVLKGGFDRDFNRFSPGLILMAELFARSAAEGFSLADLHGEDDRYKLKFTDERGLALSAQAFAPTARGRLDRLDHSCARPIARRLRNRGARARRATGAL